MNLTKQVGASFYLSACLGAHPDLLPYVNGHKVLLVTDLQAQIKALSQASHKQHFRQIKQRFSLLWALADFSQSIGFIQLGALQSQFADQSIHAAFELVWKSKENARNFLNTAQVNASESGIFILGLGKLGGQDLNFSSDVDLVAFYDKTLLSTAPMVGVSHAVTQCLTWLTQSLSEQTADGFVWRVDWRLRPYSSLRNLSMTTEKALDFYHYHARPWHRLALLKARPTAGNIALGRQFMQSLYSYLWRQNLDYRAIDDIAQLKAKINLEHPNLQNQRALEGIDLSKSEGFNLKLGHGGIREIEFIVNATQLLWGGRKPALREQNTLKTLAVLGQEQLMSSVDVQACHAAYVFLRRAENHLQMLNNEQVYHLPEKLEHQAQFIKISGVTDWSKFKQQLQHHRECVYSLFENIFNDEKTLAKNESTYIWQTQALSSSVQAIVRDWDAGFLAYGVSPTLSEQLTPLLGAISAKIKDSACPVEQSVLQLNDYFKRLPPGGQYFRLLRDYPWLLEKLVLPLLVSSTMTSLLLQSPHIIDRFLESDGEMKLDSTIVFAQSDYEMRLENLRRLANEELYLRYSDYLDARTSPKEFQQTLSVLAEDLLKVCVDVVCEEMDLDAPPIAIIGFGKLGASGMMPKSDLDLVYLCDQVKDHQLASQFTAKLNTVINTPMREGRVYELDTRLRPSGNAGSVTISLASYRQHQLQRAQTWSHLALVPARFVAGDVLIGGQFTDIKTQILSRPRQLKPYLLDSVKMLKRVQDQRIIAPQENQFSAKLRSGGLFELEYMIACWGILESIEQPSSAGLSYTKLVDQLSISHGDSLKQALSTLQNLQLEIRIFGHDEMLFEQLPDPILAHVLQVMVVENIAQLSEKINQACQVTHSLMDKFMAKIKEKDLAKWEEKPVRWAE